MSITYDTYTEGAAFEVVTEHGDRALVHDVEAVHTAVRELRRDWRDNSVGPLATCYVIHEGMCIQTITPEMRV